MKVYVVPESDSFSDKAKAWCKNRWADLTDFYDNHKAEIWIIGPSIIAGAFGLGKLVLKHHNIAAQENLKKLFVYDTHLGHYWSLRRPLNNAEWLTVEARTKAGESLGAVLDELKVLK